LKAEKRRAEFTLFVHLSEEDVLRKKGAGVSRSLKDNDITPLLDYLK